VRHLTFVLVTLLMAGEAVASPRPDWVDNPPSPDSHYVYALGDGGPAKTVADAEKAAVTDALVKLAQQIEVTITGRTIATLSTKTSDTLSEYRESVRAKVQGAEPVGAPFIEVTKKGPLFFRQRSYTAKVLVRLPRSQIEQERARHQSVREEYQKAVRDLASQAAQRIKGAKTTAAQALAVGGWREITTGRRYTLSAVLEQDLADALSRLGVRVLPMAQAKIVLSGSYRVQAQVVLATARIRRIDGGPQVPVGDAVFDVDAIEPQWLELSQPVEPTLEALEPERGETKTRVGAISIDSKPQGALVFMDGDPRGKTPVDLREVPVGQRALTLLLDGYEPHLARVRVLEGEKSPVDAALKPKTGALEVVSTPLGADVVLDGHGRGRTPLTLSDMRIGHYRLTLKLKDHEDAVVEVDVKHKETTKTEVSLTELPGSLFVVSDPPGATILVDGAEVGKARPPKFLKVDGVRAGEREVEALLPGVGSWRGTVRVRAHTVAQVTATITDRHGTLLLSLKPPEANVSIDRQKVDTMAATIPQGLPGLGAPQGSAKDVGLASLDEAAMSRAMFDRLLQSVEAPPRSLSIPLTEGKHDVAASAPGYTALTDNVTIKAGRISHLDLDLKPAFREASTGSHGKLILAILIVPGAPLLAGYNPDLPWFAPSMALLFGGLEVFAMTKGKFEAAAGIHGFNLCLGGVLLMSNTSRTASIVPTDRGVQVAWSKRF
jgi:hypothetical protein